MIMRDLERIGLLRPESLLGHYLVGAQAMGELAKGGRICTDDFPYLEFTSARTSLRDRQRPLGVVAAAPLPLKFETDPLRTYLGRMFLAQGARGRARAWHELNRAVALNPNSPARQLLLKHFSQ